MPIPPPGTPLPNLPKPDGGRAAERLRDFERDRKPQTVPAPGKVPARPAKEDKK